MLKNKIQDLFKLKVCVRLQKILNQFLKLRKRKIFKA